jgi:Ribbon-helix-helix protein, copG family
MAATKPSMVMRSVYLPPDMDEALRNLAFQLRLSKADLIRAFVAGGLNNAVRSLGPKPDEARIAKVAEGFAPGRLPEAEERRGRVSMESFKAAAAQSVRPYARS